MTTTTTETTTKFHISLNTGDLPSSVEFYRDLLGVEPSKLHGDYARFTTENPPLVLSLVQKSKETSRGPQQLSHLGFRIDSAAALAAARRRLSAAGRALREEPLSHCCYAVQDKFWVVDPDGVEWEFYHLLHDLDSMGKDAATLCCE